MLQLNDGFALKNLQLMITVAAILCTGVFVRRLLAGPLRHIPGPWTTMICSWNEFYSNILLDGQWCKTYPSLHRQYSKASWFFLLFDPTI
jgi:hypothetical protein